MHSDNHSAKQERQTQRPIVSDQTAPLPPPTRTPALSRRAPSTRRGTPRYRLSHRHPAPPHVQDTPPPAQAAHQVMGGLHCRQRRLARPHHRHFPPLSPPTHPATETTPERPHPPRLPPGAAPRADWWAPPVRHDHRGHPPAVKDGSTTARPKGTRRAWCRRGGWLPTPTALPAPPRPRRKRKAFASRTGRRGRRCPPARWRSAGATRKTPARRTVHLGLGDGAHGCRHPEGAQLAQAVCCATVKLHNSLGHERRPP